MALRDHQANAHDWRYSSVVKTLHIWAERMILYFNVQSEIIPALKVEPLRKCRGHYRSGRNSFGLVDEIAIDLNHISDPLWQVLGTIAHEILHFWQQHNGYPPSPNRRNFHNKQYRQKALDFGLIVDQCGRMQYVPGISPFLKLLKKYEVEVPDILESSCGQPQKCKSNLQLYRCSCGVKVRVEQSQFNAQCLDCGTLFMEQK